MANVLIVAYLLIVLALIAVILLQRSEGGGLGMGTSSGGLITVRGSANLLTRTTAILAVLFFATAIGLTILSEIDRGTQGILQQAADGVGEQPEAPTNVLDALNQLQGETEGALPLPEGGATTPASPTVPAGDPALALPQAPATDVTPAVPAAPAASAPAAETAPAMSAAPAGEPATTTPTARPAQPMTAPATPAQ